MKIKDLLNNVGGEIFARGEHYYNNEYISSLTYDLKNIAIIVK